MLKTYDRHVVQPGDTLTRIARLYGIADWRSIYYAPENSEFRRRRPNPDRIYPGDEIVIVRQRPGPSCELPPGPPTIGSAPPPAPPTPALPTTKENADFIFDLLPLGKVGFDASLKGEVVHPHERRKGVMPDGFMPWLLLPLGRPRVIQLVRQNTAAPQLIAADVRFTSRSRAFAMQAVAPGPPITLTLVATGEHVPQGGPFNVPLPTIQPELRAVHTPTGRPLAGIRLEAVRSIDHQGILLLRVKLQDLRTTLYAGTTREPAAVLTAFQQANALFREQANVQWLTPQQADVTTFARKDGALDAAELDALWREVRGKVPAGPRRTVVFFVSKLHNVRTDSAKLVAGATVGTTDSSLRGLIAISDLSRAPEQTLAHELGHLCGLDLGDETHPSSRRFPRNVMFSPKTFTPPSDGQQRDSLYREQIGVIRRAR